MLEYLSLIKQSYSVAFADYVREREAVGQRIIKMQTGDPDFKTHDIIVKAAQKSLDIGDTKYCDSRGLLLLRKAISEKLLTFNNIIADPKNNILVTHGAVHGIGMAIRTLVNPGDECIILEPYWRSYEANVLLAGGIPVIVKTNPAKQFQLESDEILKKITSKTKLIILNSPNNPSGAVYGIDELKSIANIAVEKNIYIISDEVYESIVFNGACHYSIASDPTVFKRVISVFSFSKTHAMTGWRIGYLVAAKEVIDEMIKLSQFSITSLSPFSQQAAIVALQNTEAIAYSKIMSSEYEKRRDFIHRNIKGTWLEDFATIPLGTFYVLIDISSTGKKSLELAIQIVDDSNVSFTPGIAFGDSMDNYLRLCFATSIENIEFAINALLNLNLSK
jgi:aspartate aminotransferase